MLNKNLTLGEFIIKNQSSFNYSSGELSRLINSIRLAELLHQRTPFYCGSEKMVKDLQKFIS